MLWAFTILKHNEIDNGRQNEHQQIDYLSSRLQQIIMRYDFLHVKVMKVIHKKNNSSCIPRKSVGLLNNWTWIPLATILILRLFNPFYTKGLTSFPAIM